MSKYAPLTAHLRSSGQGEIPMMFGHIETIIGARLPASAFRHRAWWSNNPTNSVVTRAWMEAGYVSADVDMARRTLVFRKSTPGAVSEGAGRGHRGSTGRELLFPRLRRPQGHGDRPPGHRSDGPG